MACRPAGAIEGSLQAGATSLENSRHCPRFPCGLPLTAKSPAISTLGCEARSSMVRGSCVGEGLSMGVLRFKNQEGADEPDKGPRAALFSRYGRAGWWPVTGLLHRAQPLFLDAPRPPGFPHAVTVQRSTGSGGSSGGSPEPVATSPRRFQRTPAGGLCRPLKLGCSRARSPVRSPGKRIAPRGAGSADAGALVSPSVHPFVGVFLPHPTANGEQTGTLRRRFPTGPALGPMDWNALHGATLAIGIDSSPVAAIEIKAEFSRGMQRPRRTRGRGWPVREGVPMGSHSRWQRWVMCQTRPGNGYRLARGMSSLPGTSFSALKWAF